MKLYREFATQDELDRQYNPSLGTPPAPSLGDAWAARSAKARKSLDCRQGVRFGPTVEEYVDIFPAGPNAPVHLFIHGGYWRRFSAAEHGFVAPRLVEAGISTVIVNYALCPAVTIDEITRQVRAAIAWTFDHAPDWGADPRRLTVSGHSAGGHLAAMALVTDWAGAYGRPADLVKGGLPISGLFDLAPFPYTYLQPMLQLDWAQVRRNSPILNLPAKGPRLIAAVGGDESAEFHRQSRSFVDAWTAKGFAADYLDPPGLNHSTILEQLEQPESALFQALLDLARG
jgi:arylformamidase